jgi:hypothetical protein
LQLSLPQNFNKQWLAWLLAILLHVVIAGLLTTLSKPNNSQIITPAPTIKFELIIIPKKQTSPDKPVIIDKPKAQNKTQQLVVKPDQQQVKKLAAVISQPTNQTMLKTEKPEDLLEKRKKAAASLLFLKPSKNTESGTTVSFLQSLACHDLENLDPDCQEIRKTLADINFTYGRAVMREGAVIGAKYRLMGPEELAKVFGKASQYVGPKTTLQDSSMGTKVGGSDEMRERLPNWPPDPVTGD